MAFDSLDPKEIIETIARLQQRIAERFPDSGLSRVCQRLQFIAEHAQERAVWIARPVWWLRGITWVVCVGIVVGSLSPLLFFETTMVVEGGLAGFIQVFEAGMNDLVLIGAAIFFLLTLETRYKRRRALSAIHELRAIAHIIDMHQLTKDPERVADRGFSPAESSPRKILTQFELRRYLDYCSEMLALTGKVAAVYVQRFDDSVALESASEVESLVTGLSRKIWQKIQIVHSLHDLSSDTQAPIG